MPNMYASPRDGYVTRTNQASWSDARSNTTGTGADSGTNAHAYGISADRAAARGGGYVWNIYRSFFHFDTSGITGDVSSATFKVYGFSMSNGDLIAVKSTSDIITFGTEDFTSIVGWNTTTDGSAGGDNESNVTKYSAEITSWSTSGYNDIALNAQALADIRDDNSVYICLINFDNDLKDIEPLNYTSHRSGLYYTDYSGTSRDPYIDYTEAVAVTNNATFFGANF